MNIDHPTLPQIPQLRLLWKEAFGDTDAFLDIFFSTAFDARRCFCVTDCNRIVAAAYWFRCEEYAYIYAVATAQSHRGQGLCHKLMAVLHAHLAAEGFAGCIVVPGEESLRRFYSGMGYGDFGGIQAFSCQAGVPLPMRKIDAQEFAALRRLYLPEGGVAQERENLAFLSRWAEFYAGEDYLLAATREGDTIRGLELLGNANAAPGILATLGTKNGIFHIPGHVPFAMYKSLGGNHAPTYFGFAFD